MHIGLLKVMGEITGSPIANETSAIRTTKPQKNQLLN